jgi:outer membrane protein TolC
LEKLITTARENYPKLKYYSSRAASTKVDINQRKLNFLNSVSLSYVYQPNNTIDIVKPSLFDGYQIGVHVNVGNILQTPGQIKKAKLDYQTVVAELEEYEIIIEYEVKQRYIEYIKQKKNLQLYCKILADIESIEKEQRVKFDKSEISLKDYSETLITLTSYNTTKIQTEGELLKSKAFLEEILGKKLEEIK